MLELGSCPMLECCLSRRPSSASMTAPVARRLAVQKTPPHVSAPVARRLVGQKAPRV
jgi:hypothetical protein